MQGHASDAVEVTGSRHVRARGPSHHVAVIGPLRWLFLIWAVAGVVACTERFATGGIQAPRDLVLTVVEVGAVAFFGPLWRSRIELLGDELVVVNGMRRHRVPRSEVRDVEHRQRLFSKPLVVTVADGRRIPAYGCSALGARRAPGRRAYERAEQPYRQLAAALRHWAETGEIRPT